MREIWDKKINFIFPILMTLEKKLVSQRDIGEFMASLLRRRRRRGCQKGKDGRKIGFCEKPLSFPSPGTTTATTHEPPQRGINIFRKKPLFAQKGSCEKEETMGVLKRERELSKNCYCLFFAKRERERDRKNLIRLFACSPLKRMRERGERNLFPFGPPPFAQKKEGR